jgi:hypothetical protein
MNSCSTVEERRLSAASIVPESNRASAPVDGSAESHLSQRTRKTGNPAIRHICQIAPVKIPKSVMDLSGAALEALRLDDAAISLAVGGGELLHAAVQGVSADQIGQKGFSRFHYLPRHSRDVL